MFICEQHGKCISAKVGKDLQKKALKKDKITHLVEIIYEFEPGDKTTRIGYMFSPDEAEEYNIPSPGVIIRFNNDDGATEDSIDPFKKATKSVTIMCSKCFREAYQDLIEDLAKKQNEFKEIWL